MKTIQGKIDDNDLAYVIEKFGEPILAKPCPISKNGKINPHVSRFLLKDGNLIDIFHVKPIYYETLNGEWRPLSEVTYGFGNHWLNLHPNWDKKMHPRFLNWLLKRMELINGDVKIPSPQKFYDNLIPVRLGREIFFTTTTVYPDPSPETATVDGQLGYSDTVWATAHDALAGEAPYTNDSGVGMQLYCALEGADYYVVRVFCLFDTSSIPDGDTISSAVLGLMLNSAYTTSMYAGLSQSSPASNTALVAADFDQAGTTEGATRVIKTAFTTTTYGEFTLNATGRGFIDKTGISKFGIKGAKDYDNTAPTGNSGDDGYIDFASADTTGTAKDPYLTVVHSAAGGAVTSSRKFTGALLMGVGA